MARKKGEFFVEDNVIKFEWGQNKLTVFSRVGPPLTFLLQPNGLEREYPLELAKEVFESAISAGSINIDGLYFRNPIFPVIGFRTKDIKPPLFAYISQPPTI